MSGLRKHYQKASKETMDLQGAIDEVFVTEWPVIHEFITIQSLDGQDRLVSNLKIDKVFDGYRITLMDHHFARQLSFTDKSWTQAMSGLEDLLTRDDPPWVGWTRGDRRKIVAKNRWDDENQEAINGAP